MSKAVPSEYLSLQVRVMERSRKRENQSSKLFRLISENQGLTVQEIMDKLGWTKTKTNRIVNTLEKKGWIVRRVYSAAQPKIVAKPDETVQHLSGQFVRLTAWKQKLETREKELFDKCVSMQLEGDRASAVMYANQVAEIRKIIRLVIGTEQFLLRLSTP